MIQILAPEEAKKIAAGEVVDRPCALVREFLDNALDSGATEIELAIEEGGINKVEVIDNGSGMNRDDLMLCVKTHATSKIQSLEDLTRATTLGFRGEALAAAAAVSRLEIISSTDGREAWLLESRPGSSDVKLTQTRRVKGTSVRAYGLFDTIPARKRFLKRKNSESASCRQIFIEKAMAFPLVSFRFIEDGKIKLSLLPCGNDLQKRFGEIVFTSAERSFLHKINAQADGFSVCIVFGGPERYRNDRRQQYIFANKRRVQDFALMQAFEYGLAGYFPNNSHPVGAVFVDIDPALADFNIHPAKREVRFTNAAAIHHCISSTLRNYVQSVHEFTLNKGFSDNNEFTINKDFTGNNSSYGNKTEFNFNKEASAYSRSLAMEALLERRDEFAPLPSKTQNTVAEPQPVYDSEHIRFIGTAFDLFIVVQKGNTLYFVDQHAAHERLLFNRFVSEPIQTQELLVAIPFAVSNAQEEEFLHSHKEELKELGIIIQSEGEGNWHIDALSAGYKAKDTETIQEIVSLCTAGKNIREQWAATLACRQAIKDGDVLDATSALELAKAALALKAQTAAMPRCPHGRPLWVELSRDELFRAVRRT